MIKKLKKTVSITILFISSLPLWGNDTWDIIQETIWTPKCVMCHVGGASFAEQSGLILTESVAYEELINVTPTNIHAAEEGLELVGTNGITSLYSSFLWEKINANNYEHFYEEHPEYGSIMPLGLDFLTNGELEFIRQWIIAGAPETGEVADESLLLDTSTFEPPEFSPLEIPENGIQAHLPPFDVPPNFERELFYYVPLDTQDFVHVNRITTTMRPGSHHFLVNTFDESSSQYLPEPNVFRDVRNFDGTDNVSVLFQMQFHQFISGTQTRFFDYTFPQGIALKLDPSFGFDLNSHYANYSNDTIIGEVYNNFYFSNIEDVEHVAEILMLNNTNIELPPLQESTLNTTYWVEEEFENKIKIFQLFSHAHKQNTEFKIFRVNQDDSEYRELVYVSYDWEHPPVMRYDPPMTFDIDEGLELEATYLNNTENTINFGLLSIDEMMILFGLYYVSDELTTKDEDDTEIIPITYLLHQNYPNPFNPITSLRYDLPEDGVVNITIYDIMGRIVKTLVNDSQTAGYKSIQWNAANDRNESVSAGLYLYTIQAGEFRQTKKMVLLK
tara:strand:+ start:191 stop:1864 length:1674 start_codon:yes stop_codon:yes gene_type:complete